MDGGPGDLVRVGDLAETLALLPISQDGRVIQIERLASDVSTFELGTPHAGTHSLDDQIAFQFGDGADDNDDGSSQRSASVDLLAEADELDVQPVEIVQHIEEVASGACDAIARPDQDNIELGAASIPHHLIEPRPLGLGAGDPIGVLVRRSHSRAGQPSAADRAAGSPGADRRSTPAYKARHASCWFFQRVEDLIQQSGIFVELVRDER